MFGLFSRNSKKNNATTHTRWHVLVIDADQNSRKLIADAFEHTGEFDVEFADTVSDLYCNDLSEFSAMIVDLNASTKQSPNLISSLKQRPDTKNLGIIACSVNMSPQAILEALNAGADDYLLKPYSMSELLARTRAIVRRFSSRSDA